MDELPNYVSGTRAAAKEVTACCALVEVTGGKGWVVRELLAPTPEQQAVAAKRLADAAGKEKSYIASLAKLWNNGRDVLVATSVDCATDLEKTVQFGRKNGTGVEFRKKLSELVTLRCALYMSSGTAIEVISHDDEFVQFRAYTGAKKGTYGVALKEDVR